MIKYYNLIEALEDVIKEKDKGIRFINSKKNSKFVTFENLYKKALHILNYLQSKGLKSGDELVFQLQENEDIIYIFWACILGGIIPVPVTVGSNDEHKYKLFKVWEFLNNPYLVIDKKDYSSLGDFSEENDMKNTFQSIEDKTIYVDDITDANIEDLSGKEGVVYKAKPEDIAFIQFSSGSTGQPKGVILTHENLLANIIGSINSAKFTEDDSFFSWMPLTHDMGMIGFHLVPLVNKSNIYLMPTKLFIRYPALWMIKVSEYKATILSSPNFGYHYFLSRFSPEIAEDWDLSNVRLIFNGAEPISYELCNEYLDKMAKYGLKRTSMFTVYGMAEACVAVAFPPLGEEFKTVFVDRKNLGIGDTVCELDKKENDAIGFVEEGCAIDYCNVRICDEDDTIVEDNIIGQIEIKGKNITSGYYNNKEATKAVITQDGWLRTGDLGFMREGNLVVTGRLKEIIFVNGQNYYPHDIERILEELENIQTGKVVATSFYNNETKEEEIIVFVLFKKKEEKFLPIISDIKIHLREKAALFVKHVVPIKKIPKTTSGKIQRYKLGKMFENGEFSDVVESLNNCKEEIISEKESDSTYSKTEHKIINICKEIFKVENIGLYDDFFELGVNSIKLTSLVSSLHEVFNVDIPIKDLFRITTIKELAEYITNCQDENIYSSIEPVVANEEYPPNCFETSAAQKRLYVLDQIDIDSIGDNVGYNMPEALLIEGDLDIESLEKAFNILVDRHESLRTSFEDIDGQPVQRIHDKLNFKIETYEANENEVNSIIKKFIKPFNLSKAPLVRVGLVKIGEKSHVLVLDMHHIISDGWSIIVLINELILLLEEKELPELKIQFKDLAVWQNELLKSDIMENKEKYWLDTFKVKDGEQIPVLNISTDFSRPSNRTYEGDRLVIATDRDIIDDLNKVAMTTATTLHMVMLAAYNILLAKYSGQEDIIVGSPIAGRPHKDLQNVVGMFVNMLANRNLPKHDKTFREFLAEVRENCLNAYQNQEYQFDELVGKLKIKRDMSRNPLFDYVFAVQNLDLPDMSNSKIKITTYDFEYNISRFDMFLSIMDMKETVRFMLEYSTKLFKRVTAERFLNHYIEILDQIKNNINIKIGDIGLSHNLSVAKTNILEEDDDFGF